MKLSKTVGVPVERNIAGIDCKFPRLNLKEYGEVLDAWIQEDAASIEDASAKEQLLAKIRNEEYWYVFVKLRQARSATVIINKSLAKIGNSSAEMLAMEPEELCDLAAELWSQAYQKMYLDYLETLQTKPVIVEETPTPKDQDRSSESTG
jgi:hypothetical protein